jgi:hypothetical protein
MSLRLAVAILSCTAGLVAQNASCAVPPSAPWKPLEFLVGTWEAKTQGGKSGAAVSGAWSFPLELRDHVLARHSGNSDCKGPADFDGDHGDILYIYPDAPPMSYKAIYFDNEGHVIHYDVSTPASGTAVFLSSPFQPGP